MSSSDSSSGYSLRALLIVAALSLCIGLTVGWYVSQQVLLNAARQALTDRDRYPELITAHIDSEIDLRPEQSKQVEQIIGQRFDQFWTMTDFFWPLTRSQINATADDVRAVLDQQQRQEFDAGYEQFMNRMEQVMNPDQTAEQ
jgi:hypothetical protein